MFVYILYYVCIQLYTYLWKREKAERERAKIIIVVLNWGTGTPLSPFFSPSRLFPQIPIESASFSFWCANVLTSTEMWIDHLHDILGCPISPRTFWQLYHHRNFHNFNGSPKPFLKFRWFSEGSPKPFLKFMGGECLTLSENLWDTLIVVICAYVWEIWDWWDRWDSRV